MTNPTPAQHHRATEITNEIATLGFALPGSVALRYTTCGTPGCRCHADPPQATRPLPQLDPQGRRQDRHPAPQRRTACPIRTLVPGPPAPTGTPGRTRSPLPGDHRERTTPGNRPETKNTGHLTFAPEDHRTYN